MANSGFDSGRDVSANQSCDNSKGHDWHPDLSKESPAWRAAHAQAKDAALNLDSKGTYTVKDGDTIYDIARRELKSQNAATDETSIKHEIDHIVQDNATAHPKLACNPDLIHTGERLHITASGDAAPVQQQPRPDVCTTAPGAPSQAGSGDAAPYVPAPQQQFQGPTDSNIQPGPAPYQQYPDLGQLATPLVGPNAGYAPNGGYNPGDNYVPAPPPGYGPAPYQGGYQQGYQPGYQGGDYISQEASRLSQIMVNNPHAAAAEMRDQISRMDGQSAGRLVMETKNDEYVGGLGDLQVQVERDQYGRDTGYRNVAMATPDGIEQIAELQGRPQYNGYDNGYGYGGNNYNLNPLGFIAGVVVGDLLWQSQHGRNFGNDPGWCNREAQRENYWNSNNQQFVQNWGNANYRNHYQSQNWQQAAVNPSQQNSYITNNRYDTTINNRTVNNTTINETINNTKNINSQRHNVAVTVPVHRNPSTISPIQTSPVDNHNPAGRSPYTPTQVYQGRNPGQQQETGRDRINQQQQQQTQEQNRERLSQQQQQQMQEQARLRVNQQQQIAQQQEQARERAQQQQQIAQQQEQARQRAQQQQQIAQQQEQARERAAQQQQQVQEQARQRAAQQQQQLAQEQARERAAQQAQQQAEQARQRAAQQQQQVAQQQAEQARQRAQQQQVHPNQGGIRPV